ncbi:hypothetical protein LG3211_3917 [Lysobacter gummosus]|nr:hypothetical protein LG3211_3917 [Lysobacter gummosus]
MEDSMRRFWTLLLVAMAWSGPVAAGNDLIVFVGEKLSVEKFEPKLEPGQRLMDAAFKAKFRVKQIVYGRYDGEIIDFEAYDHHGTPHFAQFKHSLMFVSRANGKLYHEKYQFYPVFRSASGEWAGCGPTGPHEAKLREGISVARPMVFAEKAFYPIASDMPREARIRWFPPEHFAIRDDKAFCLTGAPIRDLFEVKKRTVLKARGLFD